jgi:hypothetical protein
MPTAAGRRGGGLNDIGSSENQSLSLSSSLFLSLSSALSLSSLHWSGSRTGGKVPSGGGARVESSRDQSYLRVTGVLTQHQAMLDHLVDRMDDFFDPTVQSSSSSSFGRPSGPRISPLGCKVVCTFT